MNSELYPLQFVPSYHYKIWGGEGLKQKLNKPINEKNIGESWEVSTVENYVSVVKNGSLAGKSIEELVLEFGVDFAGEKVVNQYGENFPLLVKFISTDAPLSVQVHPDDAFAKAKHNSFGKTEMWYIIDAEPEAELIIGFKENVNKELYLKKLKEGKLDDILETVKPKKGEVYFIPAGRVHAIGKGITLAEIQQNSDITYRIYDYNRIDKNGETRELHTQNALRVVDFEYNNECRTLYNEKENWVIKLIETDFFKVSKLKFNTTLSQTFTQDSFTLYVCTEGEFQLNFNSEKYTVKKGETLCVPACISTHFLEPNILAEVLIVRI